MQYKDYEEWLEDYEAPEVDSIIVGHSGLEPNKRVKESELNHEELDGLFGGDWAGHYHLTDEQVAKLEGYQAQIDGVRKEANTKITALRNEANEKITAVEKEAKDKISELREEANGKITQLREEAFASINDLRKYIDEEIANFPIGGYYGTYVLTLSANAWVSAGNSTSDYKFMCDAKESESAVDLVPVGVCLSDYFRIADKAGLMNGCEAQDGFIRFYAKRVPEEDIKVAVTLFAKSGRNRGGTPTPSPVGIGQGLEYGADGRLAVKVGSGLSFDERNAVAADAQTVITDDDMVDEDEMEEDLEEILLAELQS